MASVYCDVNVYNDVERGDISSEEAEQFRRARERGDVVVRLSMQDIEEALGVWSKDPATARRRLQIAGELAGFDSLLKHPSDVFAEAIRAYAIGTTAPSPLLPRAQRRYFGSIFEKLAAGRDARYNTTLREILDDIKRDKEKFRNNMTQTRAEALAELETKYTRKTLSRTPFGEFFATGAEAWASDFADHIGVGDECRERGLKGLVAIPIVRIGIGTMMSWVHAQIAAGRVPDFGDSYDLSHAVLASTGDVFVTREKRLHEHVERIPGRGLRVVKSLAEALRNLENSSPP